MISHSPVDRRGLSIMEVLFAIGVLMVGLLGIAAVLPVGTKNAASALRTDIATSAIENQISNAVARFQGVPAVFNAPIPSRNGFEGIGTLPDRGMFLGGLWTTNDPATPPPPPVIVEPERVVAANGRFVQRTIQGASFFLPTYDPAGNFAPYNVPFQLPAPAVTPAFCVDPAFLAAADSLRPDNLPAPPGNTPGDRSVNSYDRTKFPCYDINYSPYVSPSVQMSGATAWPITPRMLRVSATSTGSTAPAPNDVVAKVLFAERDGLRIARPKDRTLPPSLFFSQVGATAAQTDTARTGNYSSMVMFAPTNASATNFEVHVIVYESRQTTQFNTNTLANEFNLSPYTSAQWPLRNNTNFIPQTYAEEVMGIVTDADEIVRGGVGTFKFIHSNRCNPDIKVGQWLMLCRLNEANGVNEYGWYRVSAIPTSPYSPTAAEKNVAANADVYVTEVEVRGKDWVFHPLMVDVTNPGTVISHPIYENTSFTALQQFGAKRNATIVVKVPRVVAVSSFSL